MPQGSGGPYAAQHALDRAFQIGTYWQRHDAARIAGAIAIFPVGGTILVIILAERSLSPLIPDRFYFPGEGLLLVIALLYLLGLTLTSVIGRWLWKSFDLAFSRLPGLGMLYRTLKQILGFDEELVNVNGGAVALGHPIGASGARIILTLAHEMRRRGVDLGGATICGGGGQGDALVVRRIA